MGTQPTPTPPMRFGLDESEIDPADLADLEPGAMHPLSSQQIAKHMARVILSDDLLTYMYCFAAAGGNPAIGSMPDDDEYERVKAELERLA